MNLTASAKQALGKFNTLLDKAAHHPVMDKLDHVLQMLNPEKIKAVFLRLADTIRGNAAVRAVTVFTDEQITRAANSALMERLEQYAILVRLNKPIGILLLLWPTMISLWIAV